MSNYRVVLLGSALMAAALADCSAVQSASPTPTVPVPASAWIGRYRSDLVRKLGEPTEAIPLIETGGELLIYANSGQTHYVFETAPGGIVDKVAVIK